MDHVDGPLLIGTQYLYGHGAVAFGKCGPQQRGGCGCVRCGDGLRLPCLDQGVAPFSSLFEDQQPCSRLQEHLEVRAVGCSPLSPVDVGDEVKSVGAAVVDSTGGRQRRAVYDTGGPQSRFKGESGPLVAAHRLWVQGRMEQPSARVRAVAQRCLQQPPSDSAALQAGSHMQMRQVPQAYQLQRPRLPDLPDPDRTAAVRSRFRTRRWPSPTRTNHRSVIN